MAAFTGATNSDSDTFVGGEQKTAGDPRGWDAEEVQRWFERLGAGRRRWEEYGAKFAGLSGADLSMLTQREFRDYATSPDGDVIYYEWQELVNPSPRTLSCAPTRDGRLPRCNH